MKLSLPFLIEHSRQTKRKGRGGKGKREYLRAWQVGQGYLCHIHYRFGITALGNLLIAGHIRQTNRRRASGKERGAMR